MPKKSSSAKKTPDKSKSKQAKTSTTAIIPGELLLSDAPIVANAERDTVTLTVTNQGDRPVQVGSHYHFFEVNRALSFERSQSFGMRLNIPSGNAVRFEPGQTHTVTLVALGGKGLVHGFNGLTSGSVRTATQQATAAQRLATWLG